MKISSQTTALEKRIKRRVIGREHTFFAVTLPGFETLCENELADLAIDRKRLRTEKGGVSFPARVHAAYAANLHLRTALRILMRIHQFRATAFHQLEKEIRDCPWELFLYAGQPFELKVTSRRSRLIHTGAIARRFSQGIARRLDTRPGLPPPADGFRAPQKIVVRGADDRFTVSLDTSGEPLYKRGLKTGGGKAPLRETLAAAALILAGYQPGTILWDPMCGTGTFALEAALMSSRIPPGWYRDFAFMGWPAYRPGRWRHLRRKAAEAIDIPQTASIFAADSDPETVAKLEKIVTGSDLAPAVRIRCRDFFESVPPDSGSRAAVVTLNPPYGRRLKTEGPLEQFYARIGRRLAARLPGWRLALILPRPSLLKHLPCEAQTLPFAHGGLDLTLATGRIEKTA